MDRTCLITGGTRGIGRALAARLVAEGDRVALTGTSEERAVDAAAELAGTADAADRVLGVGCDVRDAASVDRAVTAVAGHFGGLDVVVNNAGVGVGAPVADLSSDEWDRIIGTNLTGVFNVCRAAIPHLRARGAGWIINVSSLASEHPFAGGAAYSASKAGLNAFTEALMQEVRYDGIRVSCVLPGSVATGFSGRAANAGADWRLRPEDVADVVVHLLAHQGRSLPSRVEIRPSQPKKA
jgi:NAD(P)-dependent dehydrogenase (short-subunit alcohol dehydrogenase family)